MKRPGTCRGCVYYRSFSNNNKLKKYCNYILDVGHSRGYPDNPVQPISQCDKFESHKTKMIKKEDEI